MKIISNAKATLTDENGDMFDDNDERARYFFAKGVIETVKKIELGARYYSRARMASWLLPSYLRNYYGNDFIQDSKL
jgi:starch synthase